MYGFIMEKPLPEPLAGHQLNPHASSCRTILVL